jgi:DNA replication protein DnaC
MREPCLLAEEHATRENRRVGVALKTARLTPPKTLEGFDFSFQPSLERGRISALAQLDFVTRAEVVHFLGPPGTGKSHLATALGVAAVKAGRSVYRATLAEIVEALGRAEREGRLIERLRFYARPALLIVDEIDEHSFEEHHPSRSTVEPGRGGYPGNLGLVAFSGAKSRQDLGLT